MDRIKNAWLVLTGRAQALDITTETLGRITSEATRYKMPINDYIEDTSTIYEEQMGGTLDRMVNEMGALGQVKEVFKGVKA
ncbi:hypothetical protein ABT282_08870 [Streptomyces sp. NPDC000927]|uniref:hypothetical protein n=1 Tax=Streptomyces sp. NPDC000927 TaxID=3154371 RepID=UPI00332F13A5